MQYLFAPNAKESMLILKGDEHHYLFKVRRHKEGEIVALRNLQDEILYLYKVAKIEKKEAILELVESKNLSLFHHKNLHIGWCVIEVKNIEKILPTLNEIGVQKITFIHCKRSQQNNKIDFERLNRILLNSSQQCGRSKMMELETCDNLKSFKEQNPQSFMLNFSQNYITKKSDIATIVIGCEGGFTSDEIALFENEKIVGFDTPLILKSESAVVGVASKLFL